MRTPVHVLFAGFALAACAGAPSVTAEHSDTIPAPVAGAEAELSATDPSSSDPERERSTTTTRTTVLGSTVIEPSAALPTVEIDAEEDPASDVATWEGLQRLDSGRELAHYRSELRPPPYEPYHFEHIGPPLDSFTIDPLPDAAAGATEEIVDLALTFDAVIMTVRATDGDGASERLASLPESPDPAGAWTGDSVVVEPTNAGVVVGVGRDGTTSWYVAQHLAELIDAEPIAVSPWTARRLVSTTEGPVVVDDDGIARVSSDLTDWLEIGGVRDRSDDVEFLVDDVCSNRYVTIGVGSLRDTSEYWMMARTGSTWLPLRQLPAAAPLCEMGAYDIAAVLARDDSPDRMLTEWGSSLSPDRPSADGWPVPSELPGRDAVVRTLEPARNGFLVAGTVQGDDGASDAVLWADNGEQTVAVAAGADAQSASAMYRFGSELLVGGADSGVATLWRLSHLDAAPAPGAERPDVARPAGDVALADGSALTSQDGVTVASEDRIRVDTIDGLNDRIGVSTSTEWTTRSIAPASTNEKVLIGVDEISVVDGVPVAVVREQHVTGPGFEPLLARLFRWTGEEWTEWSPVDAPPAAHISVAPTSTGAVLASSTLTSTDFYWLPASAKGAVPVALSSIDTRVVELHVTDDGRAIALTERRTGDLRQILISDDLSSWSRIRTIGGDEIVGKNVCGDAGRRFALVSVRGEPGSALVDLTGSQTVDARPIGRTSETSCRIVGDDLVVGDAGATAERLLLVANDDLLDAPLRQVEVIAGSSGSAMIEHAGGMLGATTVLTGLDDLADIGADGWLWFDDGRHFDGLELTGDDGLDGFSAIGVHDGMLHLGGFDDAGHATLWSARLG